MAYCFSLVYLGLLLGFVKNLAPLCLGGMSRFSCSGKLLRELEVAIAEFVCCSIWFLQGLGIGFTWIFFVGLPTTNPPREEIWSELIYRRSIEKGLVLVLLSCLGLVR